MSHTVSAGISSYRWRMNGWRENYDLLQPVFYVYNSTDYDKIRTKQVERW